MKILSVLIVTGLLAATYLTINLTPLDEVEMQFNNFIAEHGKNYQNDEERNFRKSIFEEQLKIVNEHNSQGKSWTLGINKFSDWTKEEYKRLLGFKSNRATPQVTNAFADLPTNCKDLKHNSIDWRKEGFVTPVKNQGACGSCWAFSAVGSLEGAYAKKFGELVSFSEAQLVECNKFSHGCNGGLMFNAFTHWMHHAPRTEKDYSYDVSKLGKCQEDKIKTSYPELEWGYRVDITYECLYEALTHNVVSVAIRAENDDFRAYTGGVIDGDGCGIDLDHGVLVVGYDAKEDAWIIKNSWGENWGEEGFVRIRRREGLGVCGINQENSQAVYEDKEYH